VHQKAVKAALLHKEEAATKVLSTVANKVSCKLFLLVLSSNLIVPVVPTSAKARRIVKAVHGHIITLSEDSLNAVDDIGLYHFPKQVNWLLLQEPISYMGFLQACLHGMV